jgi:hypothetical protein
MRTEKIGLRDYLWRRKVPEFDNPICEQGGETNGGPYPDAMPQVPGSETRGAFWNRTIGP